MADTKRILVATAAPPIVLAQAGAVRRRPETDTLPRLGRLAWLLAALSLPAFGLTVADLVHRGGDPKTTQVAAHFVPLDAAAALTDAIPANWVGMASRNGLRRDPRV